MTATPRFTKPTKPEPAPFKSLKGLEVRVGNDGQLFTFNGHGQTVVANSGDAAQWWAKHVCKTRHNAQKWDEQYTSLKAGGERRKYTAIDAVAERPFPKNDVNKCKEV